MPYYLYECTNEECKHKQEELRHIKKRDDCPQCEECGSDTTRIFHPEAGTFVMWRHPGEEGCLTANGPTRRTNRYTVKDVAKANDWYRKMGLKE